MILKLDYAYLEPLKAELLKLQETMVVFIKPMNGRLFRVFNAPKIEVNPASPHLVDDVELIQVLNTLCVRYHNGVWYFRMRDAAEMSDIAETLHYMGLQHAFAEPDKKHWN